MDCARVYPVRKNIPARRNACLLETPLPEVLWRAGAPAKASTLICRDGLRYKQTCAA
jgi:hypothetical protein